LAVVTSAGTVSLRFTLAREPAAGVAPAVVVEVEDDGGGVAPELERRIFEPGVSGKGSSGLGLFLARRLAERFGGSLEYVPRPGGSLFRLLLPGAE
jgi:signal transduction histidine kinase